MHAALLAISLLAFAPFVAIAQSSSDGWPVVANGGARQTEVRLPRLGDGADSALRIDGMLDEPAWRTATILTGFSQYQPADSRPAADSTQVLIWYSPTAMYVGVRAFEQHGGGPAVHATLADRDRVSGDDNVEIHFDTFHDHRRAFVFIVNPLGVQADGTKSEGGGFIPGSNVMPGQNDLSPDFLWQSKGRVTDWGFEVELRIPFKSLRYAARSVQDWGVQVVRNVQHAGYQTTWTPAKRASASFIAQYGTLRDLTDMRHGQVLELNPEVTSTTVGTPAAPTTRFHYHATTAVGGNVKWGLTSNFVLNGTIKPDFSQVEADATQIATDLRFALFYPEKRPFFVEGSDQFNVPNTLVYTRRIVHPSAAAKLTGKIGSTDIALLSAVDDRATSRQLGATPVANILRIRRDFAGQSTYGFLMSDREEGAAYNRVATADLRYVFGRLYFLQLQATGSLTRDAIPGAPQRSAPMWEAVVDRTGRAFGFHYNIIAIHPDFAAWNGFVPRTGYVQPNAANRFTLYGGSGGLFERYNVFLTTSALWRYRDFFDAKSLLEDKLSASNEFLFRGGWSVTITPALQTFAFDPARYAGLVIDASAPPPSFTPSPRITTFTVGGRITTPVYQEFDASVATTAGNDVDFNETSRVRRLDANGSANFRPTDKIRVAASYASTHLTRRDDARTTTLIRIPRLKLEYQLARSIFVRFVGQYTAVTGDTVLRDPRTGHRIGSYDGTRFTPLSRSPVTDFRVDWLFSYRPNPGTVFFAGYGSSLTEEDPLAFRRLDRVGDAFFVKASYLLRR